MEKGRGAPTNTPNRFETLNLGEEFDDAWPEGEERPRLRTKFYKDHSRSVLTKQDSPDIPMEMTLNPYRGCEHGCIYCYARPTHEYLGLSAGLDFESKIFVKEDAPELLEEKLKSRAWKPVEISFSGVTDCYQPVERKLKLTRRCLEVLTRYRNPFAAITKNHLITRDVDLFGEMARLGAAAAFLSVTTLDDDLCAVLEPRTSRPRLRLDAIRALASAGVPVGVMVSPVIPGLTDHELPKILEAAAEAGASFAGYVPLRLPWAVATLFEQWLEQHYPDRKEKVLNRVRSMRDGKLNDPNFGSRMRGKGEFSEQLSLMFKLYTRKYGFNQQPLSLSTAHFARPGDQMALF